MRLLRIALSLSLFAKLPTAQCELNIRILVELDEFTEQRVSKRSGNFEKSSDSQLMIELLNYSASFLRAYALHRGCNPFFFSVLVAW